MVDLEVFIPFIKNKVYKRTVYFAEHQSLERGANLNKLARVKTQTRRQKTPAIVNFISDKWYYIKRSAKTNANSANDSTIPKAAKVFPKILGCFADAWIAVTAHFP